MFSIEGSPGTENVAQPRPTETARSPSACALAGIAATPASTIAGNRERAGRVKATKPLNCATSPVAVADNDDKKTTDEDAAKPGFDPKPVQLGGESIVDRLMPYRKKIGIMILLGFAVWGAIAIVIYIRNNKREKNTSRMAHVLDVAGRDVRPAGEPEPTPDPNDTKKKPITYPTNKERAEAVLAELAKTGANASPAYRGSLLIQAGKLDEAIAEYKKAQDGTSLDAVLAREGLGIAIETKAQAEKDAAARQKGLEDALAAFKNMQTDEKGPRYAYALYHQGRILGLLGKTAEATDILKKAKEKSGEGPLASQIDERLASLGAS